MMLRQLLNTGVILLGLGLIGIALQTLLAPIWASQVYGVPIDAASKPWVMATGMRDGVLGVIAICLLWHRAAIPVFLIAILVLPITDSVIVLCCGDGASALFPHLAGIVFVSSLLWIYHADSKIH